MTLDADLVRRRCQEIAESIERLEGIRAAGRHEAGLSQRLQLMAWFRNLLVHVYWTIDYQRVFGVLERDVDNLRDFSRIVASPVSTCLILAREDSAFVLRK